MSELLSLAQMVVRPADSDRDEAFIALSWLESGERPFVELGTYQPFPHLVAAIAEARREGSTARLRAIYRKEIRQVIRNHGPASVVCLRETPWLIVAWRCPEYSWTKDLFRGQGIEDELAAAV